MNLSKFATTTQMSKKIDNKSVINDFLISLNSAIEVLGLEKLTAFLKKFSPFTSNFEGNDVSAESIIALVCHYYGIEEKDLIINRNDGKYNDAICVIAFFLNKYANYSQKDISNRLKRHKSQVSKYISRITSLKPKFHPRDDAFIKNISEIETEIVNKVV